MLDKYKQIEDKWPKLQGVIYECPVGWLSIVDDLMAKIDCHLSSIQQIKEKFGELRFYCTFSVPSASDENLCFDYIDDAEEQSRNTCPNCGGTNGKLINDGWVWFKCEDCGK